MTFYSFNLLNKFVFCFSVTFNNNLPSSNTVLNFIWLWFECYVFKKGIFYMIQLEKPYWKANSLHFVRSFQKVEAFYLSQNSNKSYTFSAQHASVILLNTCIIIGFLVKIKFRENFKEWRTLLLEQTSLCTMVNT